MKKMFFFIFICVISLQFFNTSYSQNFRNKVLLDSAGNVYATGLTKCAQDSDIAIIRYSASDGSLVWQKKIGITGATIFKSAVLRGGYIFISAQNNYLGNKRLAIIRSDLSGNTIYTLFDRVGGDYGNDVTVDPSFNIYIAGRTDSPVNFPKFLVVKYSLNLDSIWTYVYTGPLSNNFDEALGLKVNQTGDVFVTGYTSQSQSINDSYDFLTIKLNSSGVLQWAKKYNGPANKQDEATGIVLDTASNAYVTGFSYGLYGSGFYSDFFTIKYSSNGDSLASVSYNCNTYSLNWASAITSDPSGNIYITGFGQCGGSNLYDYITVKYNSSLAFQWPTSAVFSSAGNNFPHSICYSNSNIYVSGEADSSNGDRKFMTLKYNANTGAEQWRWYLNTSDSNYANSVIADANNNVYVAGYSVPDSMITAKYTGWTGNYGFCPPFGIQTISTLVPSRYMLYQNYPNPFNPSTLIKFDILKKGNVSLKIYDLTGRKVDEIVNKEMSAGSYEEVWDGSSFVSGVYFYQLVTDSYTESKKMVILK
jgi:hypothetical protein